MRSTTNVRRRIVGGFGAMAVVLALTSVAYACTVYYGNMTFTKTGTATSKTVTGNGLSMSWCGGTQTAAWGNTKGSAQSITVTSTWATGCDNDRLYDGTYNVGLARGIMRQGGTPHINCHGETPIDIGDYIVNNGAGGYTLGGQTYNYTANASKGYDNICIYKIDGGADANSINFKVV